MRDASDRLGGGPVVYCSNTRRALAGRVITDVGDYVSNKPENTRTITTGVFFESRLLRFRVVTLPFFNGLELAGSHIGFLSERAGGK